jgi:hypothetical protein
MIDPNGRIAVVDDIAAAYILAAAIAAGLTAATVWAWKTGEDVYDSWSRADDNTQGESCPDPKVENQKNNPPPRDDIHWDSSKNRWVDADGNVYTRHNWGPEPPHWDRGSPNGEQEKSLDGNVWEKK